VYSGMKRMYRGYEAHVDTVHGLYADTVHSFSCPYSAYLMKRMLSSACPYSTDLIPSSIRTLTPHPLVD